MQYVVIVRIKTLLRIGSDLHWLFEGLDWLFVKWQLFVKVPTKVIPTGYCKVIPTGFSELWAL